MHGLEQNALRMQAGTWFRAAIAVWIGVGAGFGTLARNETEDGSGPGCGGGGQKPLTLHPAAQYHAAFLWKISADNANHKGKA